MIVAQWTIVGFAYMIVLVAILASAQSRRPFYDRLAARRWAAMRRYK